MRGSVTYRNYRAPHTYSWWARQWYTGAFAVSTRRLVVWLGDAPHLDFELALVHRGAELNVCAERSDRLLIAYDPSRFDDGRSGRVEVRLRTSDAARLAACYAAAIPDDTPPA